jgi:hypothetical protein
MFRVVVILALSLCLLFWALCKVLSHIWRIHLRQRFFPATEGHTRPVSPSTSTETSSPAPEKPPGQPKSTHALPVNIGDPDVTSDIPDVPLTKKSLLDVCPGPKIFLAGSVSDNGFDIPLQRRMSDDGDITPTHPPSGLFVTNPSH